MAPIVHHLGMATDAAALAKKTKLSAAARPVVLDGGPGGLSDALTTAVDRPVADRLTGAHDWILMFAADRASLESQLPDVATALETPGTLWVAYPKGSSKRQTDLTRDKGWDSITSHDLMWLSLISIDDDWSAFSLRHYRPGEARQTFR